MRRAPIAVALAALALLVGLAMATGSSASRQSALHEGTAPVTSAALVCPEVNGTPPGTTAQAVAADLAGALSPPSRSSGVVNAVVLAGSKSKPSVLHPAPSETLHSSAKTSQTIELAAAGSIAATVAGDQVTESATGRFRGLSGVRCETASTDWWFAGADGRVGFTDVLTLANPAPTQATVSLSMWGEKGPVVNTRLASLRINPRSVIKVPIASAAPDIATVGIHVHATSGSVTAALLEHRSAALQSNGADFIPATAGPRRSAIVAGFAPGSGPRYIGVTAPGSLDATVNLRLVTKTGSFTPSGVNQIVVRGGHSRAVSVSAALGGSTGAVSLSSDQPIFANGLSVAPAAGQRPDLMWLAASAPITGPAAIADGREPDGGHTALYLSAPAGPARLRLSAANGHSTTISVPAGKSTSVDITNAIKSANGTWPFVVTPLGAAPVYGVRVLQFSGAHGALITAEPLVGLPTPIPLPPVREDPAVAVR